MNYVGSWSEADLNHAERLRASGLSFGEVGRAIDRSARAVECALRRKAERSDLPPNPYLRDLDGVPIGTCDEMISLKRNAIAGSHKLLAEIQRVFG